MKKGVTLQIELFNSKNDNLKNAPSYKVTYPIRTSSKESTLQWDTRWSVLSHFLEGEKANV